MDVMEFFKKSEGNWFSHRTGHDLGTRKQEAGKSELSLIWYEQNHPKVLAVCEIHQVDPASVVGGAEVTWTGTTAFDEKTHQNIAFLVPVPDKDDPSSGLILRNKGYAEEAPVAGHYRMNADESMTLITKSSMTESEERLWFASANLRLRTGVVKHAGGFSITTFCSEIRRLPPEPAKAG